MGGVSKPVIFTIGTIIKDWEVIGNITSDNRYEVKCKCGHIQTIHKSNLKSKTHSFMCKTCGRAKQANTQRTPMEKEYGEFTVLHEEGRVSNEIGYLCRCSCGKETIVAKNNLVSGRSTMCRSCSLSTHGMTGHPLHQSWQNMVSRAKGYKSTIQPKGHVDYKNLVHNQEWLGSFEAFQEDMEATWFQGAQLHRANNTIGYNKDNCIWLSKADHATAHHIMNKE